MSTSLPPPAVPADGEPGLVAEAPAAEAPATEAPADQPNLQVGWRWVLAIGWGAIMGALGLLVDTGDQLGTGPWWMRLLVPPFVLPVLTLVAIARDWRSTLLLSWLATAFLGLCAAVDLARGAPAMALVEGVLALAGALLTLAAMSGVRR